MVKEAAQTRTRNAEATRAAIIEAAYEQFLTCGYEQAGVRSIAGGAGVDPALICRYFGSKEQLFAEVLALSSRDPMEVLGGDRETFGVRVAREMLDPSEPDPCRMGFIRLAIHSASSPLAGKLVRRHIEKQFMKPFSEWLGDEHAAEKAWLAAGVLMGIAAMIGIDGAEPTGERLNATMHRLASLLQAVVDAP